MFKDKSIFFKLNQNCFFGRLLSILSVFSNERKQRVTLNEQLFSRVSATTAVPHGSILGPLLFIVYINDLTDDLSLKAKLVSKDTSLFSVMHNTDTSSNQLYNTSYKINNFGFKEP